MLYIGSHTSFNKDDELVGVVNTTILNGANTFMFYTGSNQSSVRLPLNDELTRQGHELMKKHGINKDKCMVHAPFIINLANNSDVRKYTFYVNFLKLEISRVLSLGLNNLVLHPGSHVSVPREIGLKNISDGLNMALENNKDINILLEFMSGKGTELGVTIDEIKTILDGVNYKDQVFVCLDTCHLNDAGYDINEFDKFLDLFDSKIGIDKIKCIHINDSYNVVNAHKDRHANIGYGTIGFDALLNVIYNPRLMDVPKLLETPFVGDKSPYKTEIEMIKNKKFTPFI